MKYPELEINPDKKKKMLSQAFSISRFFFELMIKSMSEHLARTGRQDTLRKMRFSHQFCDDVENLTNTITNDIIALHNKDVRDTRVSYESIQLEGKRLD